MEQPGPHTALLATIACMSTALTIEFQLLLEIVNLRKKITIATIALRQLLRRVSALRQLLQLLRRWTAPAIATIASIAEIWM